jgi:hypothetical protein
VAIVILWIGDHIFTVFHPGWRRERPPGILLVQTLVRGTLLKFSISSQRFGSD